MENCLCKEKNKKYNFDLIIRLSIPDFRSAAAIDHGRGLGAIGGGLVLFPDAEASAAFGKGDFGQAEYPFVGDRSDIELERSRSDKSLSWKKHFE